MVLDLIYGCFYSADLYYMRNVYLARYRQHNTSRGLHKEYENVNKTVKKKKNWDGKYRCDIFSYNNIFLVWKRKRLKLLKSEKNNKRIQPTGSTPKIYSTAGLMTKDVFDPLSQWLQLRFLRVFSFRAIKLLFMVHYTMWSTRCYLNRVLIVCLL